MRDLELALKAAGDPTRTRILKLLQKGELCVCQLQFVLNLAPSTVSRHLMVLRNAGLVEDRRDGKWIHYRLSDGSRNPVAPRILDLLRSLVEREPRIRADRLRLREVWAVSVEELCAMMPDRNEAAGHRPAGSRRKAHA